MGDGLRTGDLPGTDEVLADPAASYWLKTALRSALCRDPVDAANDSEILARLLEERGASKSCLRVEYIHFADPASHSALPISGLLRLCNLCAP